MDTARTKAIVILCILAIALVTVFTRFNVSTDVGIFLPKPETRFEKLLRHQLDNGASTSIILLALEGLPPTQLADFNREVVGKLKTSGTFDKVINGASESSEELLSFLEKYRYLLTRNNLTEQFSTAGLKSALDARLEGLYSSTATLEKRFLRKDPTGEILDLLESWQGRVSRHKKPEELHGVWFSENHQRSLVLIEVRADISQMENQATVVQEIQSTLDAMKPPGLNVIMAGPAVFAVESAKNIREDIQNLSMMAMLLVTLFIWAAYRSVRMVALTILPLVAGMAVATAFILLFYGQIHDVTLVFGITLAGVAVDYPIHLLTSGLSQNHKDETNKLQKVWRTLRLGVFSTVIAYAAFLLSGFSGLQQLGMFTITGLVTAALFSRWALPFIANHRGPPSGLSGVHGRLKSLGRSATRFRLMVVAMLVVSVAVLLFDKNPVLHLNVDSLSPIKDERRAEGRMLREDIGFWYGGSMLMMTAPNREEALRLSEYLEPGLDDLIEADILEGFDMASHFLPSRQQQLLRKAQLEEVDSISNNLVEALADLPFQENVFDPAIEDIRALDKLEPLDADNLKDTPIGKKLDPLLFDFEDGAAAVILLHGIRDQEAIKRFADGHEEVHYMRLRSASTAMVAKSVNRVALSMIACVIIIYITLALGFKSLTRPLKIMVPTFSAALTLAAILVFSGHPLSIFHLISLLLVIGLGLDYALFFNRLPENDDEWDTTFKSLWVCAITTMLVFGVLSFSWTPPLEAIGLTVCIGTFISIVFAAMWAAVPEKDRAFNRDHS